MKIRLTENVHCCMKNGAEYQCFCLDCLILFDKPKHLCNLKLVTNYKSTERAMFFSLFML